MLVEVSSSVSDSANRSDNLDLRLKNNRGFSLVEMCVVLVIMAILAVASIPLYLGNKPDALAPEGEAVLAAYVSAALRYRANNGAFTGVTRTVLTSTPYLVDENTTDKWTFAINNVAATTFRVVATDTFDDSAVLTLTVNYDLSTTPHQTLVQNF